MPLAEVQASPPVVIETDRLMLRRPTLADAPSIARLANDRRIAEMTRRLPNPYRLGDAVGFVESLAAGSSETVFLIEHLHTPVGMVGIDWRDADAPELGYWLGCEFWGRGFATEAARAVIDDAFEAYAITHIVASARVANPASRNILEKCGFQWTGVQLHRVESLQSSTPVDCFRLTRSVWSSLKHWTTATKHEG
jgi:RimJ/RimL family protein N-acetyltransferase